MKPQWVWILLVASLGFNVFFAVGYYNVSRTAQEMKSFEGRARQFTQQLKLDDKQEAVFEQMLAETSKARAAAKRERLPAFNTFLTELAREQPNEKVLLDYAEQDFMREYRRQNALRMAEFLAVLTPQQKQTFLKTMESKAQSDTQPVSTRPSPQ
ncbi:MAG: hypothetical protein WD042_04215 [Phycisphaeraceae bacterium]